MAIECRKTLSGEIREGGILITGAGGSSLFILFLFIGLIIFPFCCYGVCFEFCMRIMLVILCCS